MLFYCPGLKLVSQREDMSEYMKQAIVTINDGLQSKGYSNTNVNGERIERVIGSILIVDIIIGGEVINLDKLSESIPDGDDESRDLVSRILERRDSKEIEIRRKVRAVHTLQFQLYQS
jgi:hypothetical protein